MYDDRGFSYIHLTYVCMYVCTGPILEGDMDIGGAKVGPFLEALEVSIQSSLNVLQHLATHPPPPLPPPTMDGEGAAAGATEDHHQARQHHHHQTTLIRRMQEKALEQKQDALEAVLRAYPEFAWRRNRILRKAVAGVAGGKSSSRKGSLPGGSK